MSAEAAGRGPRPAGRDLSRWALSVTGQPPPPDDPYLASLPGHHDGLAGVVTERPWLADVRLRALRRVLWLRQWWGRSGYGDESILAISHSEVDRALVPPAATAEEEQAFHRTDPRARRLSADLEALWRDGDGPWDHLVTALGLTAREANLFALAMAAEAIPAFRRVYGYLRDEASASDATPGLAASLWTWPAGTGLGSAAALRRWSLARPVRGDSWPGSAHCEWRADPAMLSYLLCEPPGSALPGRDGGPRYLSPPAGAQSLAPTQLAEVVSFITAMRGDLRPPSPGRPRIPLEVEIVGPAGTGRTVFAAQVTAAMQFRLLGLDATALTAGEGAFDAVIGLARTALLDGAAVVWRNADALEPAVLADIRGRVQLAFLTTQARLPVPVGAGTIRWTVSMPALDRSARLRLWAAAGAAGNAPEPVAEWPLRPTEIMAVARAALAGGAAAKKIARSLLLPLGQEQVTSLPLPYTWPDLVVPAHVGTHLREIAEQAHARGQVLDDWGLRRLTPMGGGLTALFAGPSGTGKTMAAQVLARSLGLDLFCVDLAGVVSKYIGETEKLLRGLFDACERAPAVLFFDEADALFGRRTQVSDSHDRFANIEIDYLLQRMERFNGLAVLASNRKGDLDEAFVRRLRFIVDFVPPGIAEREKLWRLALDAGPGRPGQPLVGEIDFRALARDVDLTGAGIKSAALAAAFLARTDSTAIGMAHVLAAARRELAKQGVVLRPATGQRP